MCGIILLAGPRAHTKIDKCLDLIKHRGPDEKKIWHGPNIALGFARLIINGDKLEGQQPFQNHSAIGVVNGEFYNHLQLKDQFNLKKSHSDTDILLPLVQILGPKIIHYIDGFYAAVIVQKDASKALCLRDHIGKKPLFVGQSDTEIFISSELKAIEQCHWFKALPLGASEVDLHSGEITQLESFTSASTPSHNVSDLAPLFEQAVLKRLPLPSQPVGIFLSGGLDSSIVAATVAKFRTDATYFILGNSEDNRAAKEVVSFLKLKDIREVAIPTGNALSDLIERVVYTTESYNPSIISNGLATYLLAQAAHQAGIKVVLTGDGADEFFGGYHQFQITDPWQETRQQLIDDMCFTELRRLDLSCMAHSIEPRCPFLDLNIRALSDNLKFSDFYSADANKAALRHAFVGRLPAEILDRKKMSCDVGSGIRKLVVNHLRRDSSSERLALKEIWKKYYSFDETDNYFHRYPVFDEAINMRGESHK